MNNRPPDNTLVCLTYHEDTVPIRLSLFRELIGEELNRLAALTGVEPPQFSVTLSPPAGNPFQVAVFANMGKRSQICFNIQNNEGPYEHLIDTVIHEFAHYLVFRRYGGNQGHTGRWKAICRELGCRPEPYAAWRSWKNPTIRTEPELHRAKQRYLAGDGEGAWLAAQEKTPEALRIRTFLAFQTGRDCLPALLAELERQEDPDSLFLASFIRLAQGEQNCIQGIRQAAEEGSVLGLYYLGKWGMEETYGVALTPIESQSCLAKAMARHCLPAMALYADAMKRNRSDFGPTLTVIERELNSVPRKEVLPGASVIAYI